MLTDYEWGFEDAQRDIETYGLHFVLAMSEVFRSPEFRLMSYYIGYRVAANVAFVKQVEG